MSAPKPNYRCPFCGSDRKPLTTHRVAVGGWICYALGAIALVLGAMTHAALFFVGFALLIVGIFLNEKVTRCADCGTKWG